VIEYAGVSGRRVLITGATTGLGFAMANALVSAGARVFVTGRSQAKIDRAVSELRSRAHPGGACEGAALDVRDSGSIRSGRDQMLRLWGGIDVLINNAGLGMRTVNPRFLTEPMPFWEVPVDRFRDVIDTNLTGYFAVAREVVPLWLTNGTGRIVNIGVSEGTMRRQGFTPYGPSRAGSESLSHVMAQDVVATGITVNLLLPGGATDTGMVPEDVPPTLRERLLSPDVMAEPTLFLCSDEAARVTDQRIIAKDFQQWKKEWAQVHGG